VLAAGQSCTTTVRVQGTVTSTEAAPGAASATLTVIVPSAICGVTPN